MLPTRFSGTVPRDHAEPLINPFTSSNGKLAATRRFGYLWLGRERAHCKWMIRTDSHLVRSRTPISQVRSGGNALQRHPAGLFTE